MPSALCLCVCVCVSVSIPVISEQQARDTLAEYCDKKCCWGTGAARAMSVASMQSTSAFHVCRPLLFESC